MQADLVIAFLPFSLISGQVAKISKPCKNNLKSQWELGCVALLILVSRRAWGSQFFFSMRRKCNPSYLCPGQTPSDDTREGWANWSCCIAGFPLRPLPTTLLAVPSQSLQNKHFPTGNRLHFSGLTPKIQTKTELNTLTSSVGHKAENQNESLRQIFLSCSNVSASSYRVTRISHTCILFLTLAANTNEVSWPFSRNNFLAENSSVVSAGGKKDTHTL